MQSSPEVTTYLRGSETDTVFRDSVTEDGYSFKRNVKPGMLVPDSLLGSRQNMC
jgi:hypothetical protein